MKFEYLFVICFTDFLFDSDAINLFTCNDLYYKYYYEKYKLKYSYHIDSFQNYKSIKPKLLDCNITCINGLNDLLLISSHLTHLHIYGPFNNPLNNLVYAKTLNYLEIASYKYNYNLDNMLPENLTYLSLNVGYNESLDVLPPNLLILKFAKRSIFNRPIKKLPPKLKELEFGREGKFNQMIDNLPHSLTRLICSRDFNFSVDNVPKSLIELELGEHFNNYSINLLSEGLQILRFGSKCRFNEQISQLPQSLRILEFLEDSIYNQPLPSLPPKLMKLVLGGYYNKPIVLNNRLKYLIFGPYSYFNQPIDIPNSVIYLKFDTESQFNQFITFPTRLQYLEINTILFNTLARDIPDNVAFVCEMDRVQIYRGDSTAREEYKKSLDEMFRFTS